MFNRILVPLDGSETSELILPYAAFLAKALDIPMLLLSVVDPDALDIPEKFGDIYGPWESALRRRHAELVARLEADGLRPESMVSYGRAHREILSVAAQRECGLIAMPTKGRGLLGWAMLGSVTYNVVHTSPVPVLTIAPATLERYRHGEVRISRIVLTLDGSALAETALPYVEHLVERRSLEALLIRVVAETRTLPALLSRLIPAEVEKELEADAESYLQDVTARLRDKGLAASWRVLKGIPGPRIVELVREEPDDLVVMTTRGKSGLIPGVLGSVSISVLRNSGNPVLIIPPQPG